MKYGQHLFNFDEGVMSFMAPNRVFSIALNNKNEELKQSGWPVFIHPDFIWNTSLAKTIQGYHFWDYSKNEALFLSAKEKATISNIILNSKQEYYSNIDKFSKQIIISQLKVCLIMLNDFKIVNLLELTIL